MRATIGEPGHLLFAEPRSIRARTFAGLVPSDSTPGALRMDVVVSMAIGALVGIHMATWGMYKDSIHEGFTWSTYVRSIIVATVLGAIVQMLLKFDTSQPSSWAILFGLLYVCER